MPKLLETGARFNQLFQDGGQFVLNSIFLGYILVKLGMTDLQPSDETEKPTGDNLKKEAEDQKDIEDLQPNKIPSVSSESSTLGKTSVTNVERELTTPEKKKSTRTFSTEEVSKTNIEQTAAHSQQQSGSATVNEEREKMQ